LTVSDGRHAASIAILGNYMARSFDPADGHGDACHQHRPQRTDAGKDTRMIPP